MADHDARLLVQSLLGRKGVSFETLRLRCTSSAGLFVSNKEQCSTHLPSSDVWSQLQVCSEPLVFSLFPFLIANVRFLSFFVGCANRPPIGNGSGCRGAFHGFVFRGDCGSWGCSSLCGELRREQSGAPVCFEGCSSPHSSEEKLWSWYEPWNQRADILFIGHAFLLRDPRRRRVSDSCNLAHWGEPGAEELWLFVHPDFIPSFNFALFEEVGKRMRATGDDVFSSLVSYPLPHHHKNIVVTPGFLQRHNIMYEVVGGARWNSSFAQPVCYCPGTAVSPIRRNRASMEYTNSTPK